MTVVLPLTQKPPRLFFFNGIISQGNCFCILFGFGERSLIDHLINFFSFLSTCNLKLNLKLERMSQNQMKIKEYNLHNLFKQVARINELINHLLLVITTIYI